jgi:hypothetical protein
MQMRSSPGNLAIMANDPDSLDVVSRLREEIKRLTYRQSESLRVANSQGMTLDEAKEYDERRSRITELVRELAELTSAD